MANLSYNVCIKIVTNPSQLQYDNEMANYKMEFLATNSEILVSTATDRPIFDPSIFKILFRVDASKTLTQNVKCWRR
jgi:hypothetical protein